jgi:hypothetical protein
MHSEFQKHCVVKPDLRRVLQTPSMGITFVYSPSDISNSKRTVIPEKMQHRIVPTFDACSDAKAISIGWSVENDVSLLGRSHEEHSLSRVLALFVGWASIGAAKGFWNAASYGEGLESIESQWRVRIGDSLC